MPAFVWKHKKLAFGSIKMGLDPCINTVYRQVCFKIFLIHIGMVHVKSLIS
jgi:hypothetical protein